MPDETRIFTLRFVERHAVVGQHIVAAFVSDLTLPCAACWKVLAVGRIAS